MASSGGRSTAAAPQGRPVTSSAGTADADGTREVYRIVVDVLAVPEQVEPLVAVLGTALCGRPDDHPGPCRVAWRIRVAGPDGDPPLDPSHADDVRRALAALEVWPTDRATSDLLADAGAAAPAVTPATERSVVGAAPGRRTVAGPGPPPDHPT